MSVQGSQFQFGVAYRLKNHKFRVPTLFTSTINSVTNTTSIIINNIFANTEKIVRVGDLLNISNTSNQAENVRIKSILTGGGSLTQFTLETPLVNTYVSTNPVRVQGTAKAGGWNIYSGNANPSEVQTIKTLTHRLYGKGASDDYGQSFRTGSSQGKEGTFTKSGLSQDLTKELITPFAYYRLGVMYRIDIVNISGNVSLIMNPEDSIGALPITTIKQNADEFAWTRHALEFPSFFRKNTGSNTPKFRVAIDLASSTSEATAFIDDVWLEHAKGVGSSIGRINSVLNSGGSSFYQITLYETIGTSRGNFDTSTGGFIAIDNGVDYAQLLIVAASGSVITGLLFDGVSSAIARDSFIQMRNKGYWELPDRPVQSSVRIVRSDDSRSNILSDGSGQVFYPVDGDRAERYLFSAKYMAADQDIWDGMMALLRWQEKGHLISFHPFIDDLPTVMIGKLTIRLESKETHFDLARRDFSFDFEELVV